MEMMKNIGELSTSMNGLLVGCAAVLLLVAYLARRRPRGLSYPDIPAVGCSGDLAFYFGAARFFVSARSVLDEGYSKARLFKVAVNHDWYIVASGPSYMKDLLNAPDTVLSVDEANNERFQILHTVGSQLWTNAQTIRSLINQLTRDMEAVIPLLLDEASLVWDKEVPNDGWKSLNALDFAGRLVAQVNSRVFVGPSKARDAEYRDLVLSFPRNTMLAAMLLQWFPTAMRPILGKVIAVPTILKRVSHHLSHIIQERREYEIDESSHPYDLLWRVVEHGNRPGRTADNEALIFQFMMINFGAMHSTTYTFTHAVFHLATRPEVADILREEAREALKEHGWTRTGIASMRRLDSFLRESQRMNAISAVGSQLKVVKPFTFSDGVTLPTGTTIIIPLAAMLADETVFPDPLKFDPWRFYAASAETQTMYATAGLDYPTWGFAKHTCPGRFYASTVLKSMLAYLVLHTDVRLAGGATKRPSDVWVEANRMPNPFAKIELRRRSEKVYPLFASLSPGDGLVPAASEEAHL